MGISTYIFSVLSAILVVVIPLYIIISVKTLKQKIGSQAIAKSALIKIAILPVLIVVSIPVFTKTMRYHTFDKYLVENQDNNIRYTIAYVDKVWENYRGKYYTIREYSADFIFFIDNIPHYKSSIVPEDFTNYTYFVKVNIDNTKYSEIILTQLKMPSNFEVPVDGWTSNPITALSNHIIREQ